MSSMYKDHAQGAETALRQEMMNSQKDEFIKF
jgi:hypothetical protein